MLNYHHRPGGLSGGRTVWVCIMVCGGLNPRCVNWTLLEDEWDLGAFSQPALAAFEKAFRFYKYHILVLFTEYSKTMSV